MTHETPLKPPVERYPGRYAAESPERLALIHGGSGWTQTYRELDDRANRVSQVFAERGLVPGDHVMILLDNHERFLEVAWGAHYAGLVYTPCSTRLTAEEVSYIASDSGARAIVSASTFADVASEVASGRAELVVRLVIDGAVDGFESYEAAVNAASPEPLPSPRTAGADMLYSSGTTGRQKAIVRSVKAAPLETAPVGVSWVARKLFGFDESTVYLCPAPLYHGAGIRFVMAATALGGTAVIMDKFDAEKYLDLVQTYAVTHSQVVPTMMSRMMQLGEDVRAGFDTSSLQYFVHSAAPCPPALKAQVIDWLGPVVYEYYAGTESNGVVFCDSQQWLEHRGTVGRPIGCEIFICDDEGVVLPPGETGTVYLGNGSSFEYHGDAAKTAASRHARGWSTLGDIGHVDEDGFLYLTDRKAFMIISGGVNIYPQEAENVLATHPDVFDVAVFGIPNLDFGEEVKAVVQPVQMPVGDEACENFERELIAFCRSHLADIKCPRSVDFREELPRDPSGKMMKRGLRDEYVAAGNGAVGAS
ncbi:AMP-binding protein [Microbacterium lacus]|uniref:AMP-binding protein n=1 Tax=Microbacterium lacus TaxID=415217 RepID=UPI0038517D29